MFQARFHTIGSICLSNPARPINSLNLARKIFDSARTGTRKSLRLDSHSLPDSLGYIQANRHMEIEFEAAWPECEVREIIAWPTHRGLALQVNSQKVGYDPTSGNETFNFRPGNDDRRQLARLNFNA